MKCPRIALLSQTMSRKDIMIEQYRLYRDSRLSQMMSEVFSCRCTQFFTSHAHIYIFMSILMNSTLAFIYHWTCHLPSCVAHSLLPHRFPGRVAAWGWGVHHENNKTFMFLEVIYIYFEVERCCTFVYDYSVVYILKLPLSFLFMHFNICCI